MKRRLIPLLLSVIAVFSSCENTTNSSTEEITTTTTTITESQIETPVETTTTTVTEAITTTTETTTTAPTIEPIIEHEKLPMQEAFIKVVENDAQEKVTKIVEYSEISEYKIPFKTAFTESGKTYLYSHISFGNLLSVQKKLYDDNALVDVSTLSIRTSEYFDTDKEIFYESEYPTNGFAEGRENLTLSEILSRYLGADISIESIENIDDNGIPSSILHCNHNINILSRREYDPNDIDRKHSVSSESSLLFDPSPNEKYDVVMLFYYK